ncbi:MAG: LytR/AlgR family response regulator transcription factor, partial [Chryseotalea sp.]
EKTDGLMLAANAYNGYEALKILQAETIDILFLDIEMPLVTGMELLASLTNKPATIVTTAYQDFAFDAWQHDAVDYLKKPVSYIRFAKAIEKAKLYCKQQNKVEWVKKILTLKVDGKEEMVSSDTIMYLSALGNYVKIFSTGSQKPMIVYDSLQNLQQQLDADNFIQIHRSHVVNKVFIKNVDKVSVFLTNGECLPLGRKFQILLENI